MQIKRQSGELDKVTSYKLTKSKGATSLKDSVDSTIDVAAWVLYEDSNSTGELVEVLAIQATDGEVFTTISQTFIRDFMDVDDHFEGEIPTIKVVGGTSKSGREYIACDIA